MKTTVGFEFRCPKCGGSDWFLKNHQDPNALGYCTSSHFGSCGFSFGPQDNFKCFAKVEITSFDSDEEYRKSMKDND